MIPLVLKSLAVLFLILSVIALVLFRVDENRVGNSMVSITTIHGATLVRVVYSSSIANLLRYFSSGQLYAITVWNRIYVTSDFLTPDNLQHELEHVRQWHLLGRIGFPVSYVYDLLRVGYHKHPLEIAARHVAGQVPWIR